MGSSFTKYLCYSDLPRKYPTPVFHSKVDPESLLEYLAEIGTKAKVLETTRRRYLLSLKQYERKLTSYLNTRQVVDEEGQVNVLSVDKQIEFENTLEDCKIMEQRIIEELKYIEIIHEMGDSCGKDITMGIDKQRGDEVLKRMQLMFDGLNEMSHRLNLRILPGEREGNCGS